MASKDAMGDAKASDVSTRRRRRTQRGNPEKVNREMGQRMTDDRGGADKAQSEKGGQPYSP
jgi:hypothetical protein